ncbi:hypothetical protein ACQ4PT_006155 [Festuca glaucescens]
MAPKRKWDGNGTVEEDDSTLAQFIKPVYLVAEREDEQSSYSVFKIDADAGATPQRACTVARMPGTERGMSFVAACSKHGSWIVAVGGGPRAGTVIFDPSTSTTYRGPRLSEPKHEPVLISHRGEVYAISRRPRVAGRMDLDPWFECLSFNKGLPTREDCPGAGWASWIDLTPPPFFPSVLNPYQFRNPPEISVTSHVGIGTHVLISARQNELMLGTYAFHVVNKTWEKVHDKNLPFIGQAMPLGKGSLFAACPLSSNDAAGVSVFNIKVSLSTTAPLLLTIKEFPVVVASEGRIPRPLVCPLGMGRFCSVSLGPFRRSRRNANLLKKIQVILATFQTDNVLATCQSNGSEAKDLRVAAVQVKEENHTYKFKGRRSRLLESVTTSVLVAALSM